MQTPVSCALLLACMLVITGCGDTSTGAGLPLDPSEPEYDSAALSSTIDNPYLPLTPGMELDYSGDTDDGFEEVFVEVLPTPVVVSGVECRAVSERTFVDGELVEDAESWYAQDQDGNVWILGETATEYVGGVGILADDTWVVGENGATAGIIMKGTHYVGDLYTQLAIPGITQEVARVVASEAPITLGNGSNYKCLEIIAWDAEDDSDVPDYSFYAEGVGLVLEEDSLGNQAIELVAARLP